MNDSPHPWLTGLLAEIAEVIGDEGALAIAAAKGGARASFPTPERLHDGHWLVAAVGIDRARALCQHFKVRATGQQFSVPVGPQGGYRAQQRARARALRKALEAKASIDEAARMVGVDRSTVIRAKQRLKKPHDTDQGSFHF